MRVDFIVKYYYHNFFIAYQFLIEIKYFASTLTALNQCKDKYKPPQIEVRSPLSSLFATVKFGCHRFKTGKIIPNKCILTYINLSRFRFASIWS